MRVFAVAGAAIIVLAAVIVPLPWAVAEPGVLVAAADAVSISIAPQLLEGAGAGADPSVSGAFFATRHLNRAAAVQLLAAAVMPGAQVERASREPSTTAVHPVVAATMAGLGIVPRYADLSELPVKAAVTGAVDSQSVGLALHAFDVGTPQDVARGRRIAGLGQVLDGSSLVCTPGIPAAVRTAAAQSIDVVVVPTECVAAAWDAIPRGATLEVLDADVLSSAAEALLGS